MPADPTHYIAEILGEPAHLMRNPVNAGYQCPFTPGVCSKRSHSLDEPFPVCSVFRRGRANAIPNRPPICVCPKRLFESDLVHDLIENCWTGAAPENPRVAYEVNMEKFGTVDFVLADVDRTTGVIRDFISVELQAVDITGTYLPAYTALINAQRLEQPPVYGFNWANVRKRFISQIITKGFYHHHWDTRIVAVVQEDLFNEFTKHGQVAQVPVAQSNVIFMVYQFRGDRSGGWKLGLKNVVPTTHANVMTAGIYEKPPSRSAFESRIRASL